jgi:hypothetical protein
MEISCVFKFNGKIGKPIAHFAACARVGRKSKEEPGQAGKLAGPSIRILQVKQR